MKTSFRTWLRGAFVFAIAAAALALPSSAMAITPNTSSALLSEWATADGSTSVATTFSFTSAPSAFLVVDDKIDRNGAQEIYSLSGSTNFSATANGCAYNTKANGCTITVTFAVPSVATALPYYETTLKLFSKRSASYDGVVTVRAYVGVKGVDGTPGADGTNGTNGAAGSNGANGANGTNGTDGTNGAAGTTGATGATGAQGPTGADGAAQPDTANAPATLRVATRSTCTVKRNAKRLRVVQCLVKLPANTPTSKLVIKAGGTTIHTGTVRKNTRTLRITKMLPKTVGGWIGVSVTTA